MAKVIPIGQDEILPVPVQQKTVTTTKTSNILTQVLPDLDIDMSKLPLRGVVLAAAPFFIFLRPVRNIVQGVATTYLVYRLVKQYEEKKLLS